MKFWKVSAYKAAFKYARSLTAQYSKSFYISTLMLPKERRWATYAVYGLCRHVDNLIDNPRLRTKNELHYEIKCLTDELKVSYRTGESEHPIIQPFIIVARKYSIPIEYPLDLLKGVQMDIEHTRYKTFDDLYIFCYRVAGVVGLMMTHVLGYKDEAAFPCAEKLGIAMQLTNILRDVKEDKEMGRIYLPLNELRQFRVTEQDIIQENISDNLHQMLKYQVKRAHGYYEEANKGIPMLKTESQFAIYAASKIYRGILRKIETRGYNPFLGRVFVPLKKKIVILFQEIIRTKLLIFRERYFTNG